MSHRSFWTFALVLLLGSASAPMVAGQPAAGLEGAWHGDIDVPGQPVGVVFHLEQDGDAWTATLDVPAQGAAGIPVSDVRTTADSLHLGVAAIGGTFEGRVEADGARVAGTWEQGGAAFPLVLQRGTPETNAAPERRRPQEPQPPFPYEAEDVRFPGGAEGVTLAGTLTMPEGEGPHPAVVLLSGSGPQDRNEETRGFDIGHKSFLVLADYLTLRGIAVLRYDDRGVAESTGSLRGATMEAFADDARAALTYLRGRGDLSLSAIGFAGHSEGGMVAPMAAASSSGASAPDFLVLLAGPAVPMGQVVAAQVARMTEESGASPGQVAQARAQRRQLFDAVAEAPDSAAAAGRIRGILAGAPEAQVERTIGSLTTPYVRHAAAFDPAAMLQRIDVPVLALFGEKDFQVPPEQNAPPMREALAANPGATVEVLPGLNHLFQTAETGLLDEYGQIEETFAPVALERIAEWIAAHGGEAP